MQMGMGQDMGQGMDNRVYTPLDFKTTYECKHCGEQHGSDDTELWCGVAKIENEKKKEKENVKDS